MQMLELKNKKVKFPLFHFDKAVIYIKNEINEESRYEVINIKFTCVERRKFG